MKGEIQLSYKLLRIKEKVKLKAIKFQEQHTFIFFGIL